MADYFCWSRTSPPAPRPAPALSVYGHKSCVDYRYIVPCLLTLALPLNMSPLTSIFQHAVASTTWFRTLDLARAVLVHYIEGSARIIAGSRNMKVDRIGALHNSLSLHQVPPRAISRERIQLIT